jgi:hypothetical protein
MLRTETAVIEEAPSYPLTELNLELTVINKDPEFSSEQGIPRSEAIEREPSTPFFKLVVAGYSFFCAGVNDGTCKQPLRTVLVPRL